MAVALLLTFLALLGAALGIVMGHSSLFSRYLAAAGGGLLFGISVFWLVPEIAEISGWTAACGMTAAACAILALADHLFLHSQHSHRRLALGPILAATAVHSFLDGWSIRALGGLRMASIAAPLGLALHKIPEGLALGWVTRTSLKSYWKAAMAATAVELFTVVGAVVEPHANRSGFAAFGSWWTSTVVAIIGGSFLFLGIHTVLPNRRRLGVMLVFAITLALVGSISLVRAGGF
jgi:zinc transporter ZupT